MMTKEVIEPEIETEENKESEEQILIIPQEFYDEEINKIKRDPVNYICDWMESNLIHIGKKVFRLICLQPCSMIIPSIPMNSIDIRANINVFIIGSPACGKSTLAKKFCSFAYFPLSKKGISAPKLAQQIDESEGMFSLSLDDFSNFLEEGGYEAVKILEGAIGDEKEASRENMMYSIRRKTQAIALICGTWIDLKKYSTFLKGGLLSRMSLLFISLNEQQRREKAKFINDSIGRKGKEILESRMKQQIISDYYKILFDIQNKKQNAEKPQVKGYLFNSKLNDTFLAKYETLTSKYTNDITGDFSREQQDAYRFLISHAFINIFNREIKDGILILTKEDYDFATEMMETTLKNKLNLVKSRLFLEMGSSQEFVEAIQNPKVNEDTRNILLNLYPHGQKLLREKQFQKKIESEKIKNLSKK